MIRSRPICINCHIEFTCEKNGQLVNDVNVPPYPSTYWAGDLWECPVCHVQIVVGLQHEGMSRVEQAWAGRDVDDSITFAHGPEQLTKYADQF